MPGFHAATKRSRRLSTVIRVAPIAYAVGAGMALTACTNHVDPASSSLTRHTVRPGAFEIVLDEAGSVEATRVISIINPLGGRLIHLPPTGTTVRQGDVIVQLETERVEESIRGRLNELQSLQAELEATIESLQMAMRDNLLDRDLAQSQLEFSTIRLQDVKVRLAETEVLLESAVVPEADLRAAEYNVDSTRLSTVTTDLSLRTQVATSVQERTDRYSAIARSELRGRRALRSLERAQLELEQATITSPINGIFLRTSQWDRQSRSMREPQPGEDVRRRQELGQIPDLDSLVVRTQIPESYLMRVSRGMPATIEFDAHEGLVLTGTVDSIGNVAIEREESAGGAIVQTDQSSGQKVFEVRVALDTADERLRPGITAQVRFVLDSRQNVVMVPIDAIHAEGMETTVMVLGPDGRHERRPVTLGDHNGERVIVLDGLTPGEMIGIRRRSADESA